MLLRRFTDLLLRNRWQAIGITFLLAFIPVIGSLSIIIAALITLRKGAFEGSLVLFAATAPALISFFTGQPVNPPGLMLALIEVVLISNFLTWFFAVLLRHYRSWPLIIEAAALLGMIFVIAVHIAYPDIQNWWASQMSSYFNKSTELAVKLKTDVTTVNEMEAAAISSIKHYASGIAISAILFNTLVQLLFARWWQAVVFNPGGLRKELHAIRLSYAAGLVFMAVLVLSFFNIKTALDVEAIPIAAFAAGGLSLIHCLLGRLQGGWIWLLLAYIIMIWIFPFSAIIISFVALVDTWVDFRKKLKFLN